MTKNPKTTYAGLNKWDGWVAWKGEHTPEELKAEFIYVYGEDYSRTELLNVKVEWMRFVPNGLGGDSEFNGYLWPAKPHSRGAFLITSAFLGGMV
jgi:hypothetical protein